MAKLIKLENNQSGLFVESAPFFGYEVSLYKLYKGRAELIGQRWYKSTKALKLKKDTVYLKCKNYTLMKCIDLFYAPEDYINEYNLNKENVRTKFKSKSKN